MVRVLVLLSAGAKAILRFACVAWMTNHYGTDDAVCDGYDGNSYLLHVFCLGFIAHCDCDTV